MSYSRLSEVVNYKRGLSPEAASRAAKKLGLNDTEADLFVTHVKAAHGRSALTKRNAKKRLANLVQQKPELTLQTDVFEMISNWYHYAIVELTHVSDFRDDLSWIAKRLGINPVEAELAIQRLLKIGLLDRKHGRLKAVDAFNASTSGIPSESLKRHHEQILEKATKAIFLQSVEERDLSAITMAIDPTELPRAKELIKKFRREFTAIMESSKKKTAVYCLSAQFFRIDNLDMSADRSRI